MFMVTISSFAGPVCRPVTSGDSVMRLLDGRIYGTEPLTILWDGLNRKGELTYILTNPEAGSAHQVEMSDRSLKALQESFGNVFVLDIAPAKNIYIAYQRTKSGIDIHTRKASDHTEAASPFSLALSAETTVSGRITENGFFLRLADKDRLEKLRVFLSTQEKNYTEKPLPRFELEPLDALTVGTSAI